MTSDDRLEIQNVIGRFANSFDLKDWRALQDCLAGSLEIDYTDLRGTPPGTVGAEAYVAARREALDHLQLHHLAGSYEIEFPASNHATCRASMIIWRKSGVEQFTSHCIYTFQLAKQGPGWKISGIRQKILWNEGDASVHSGVKG